jgi:hypothetical protein
MEYGKSIHLKRKESNEREKESRRHQEKREKGISSKVVLEKRKVRRVSQS